MNLLLIGTTYGFNSVFFEPIPATTFRSFSKLGWGGSIVVEYYRVALTRAVLDSLTGLRWLYGFGPGTFQLAGIQSDFTGHLHVLKAPDLHYVQVLADLGIVGLGSFSALLLSIILTCVGALRGRRRSDAAACLASVIGFILVNATVSMFYTLPLALVFWLAVARATVLYRKSAQLPRVIERRGTQVASA